MAGVYPVTAPTTARKEAAARVARKGYEKRKTRAAQVAALLEYSVQAATYVAAAAPHLTAAAASQRQTAGTAHGGAGSREGLLPHPAAAVPVAAPVAALAAVPASVPGVRSAPAVAITAAAVERIRAAAG